MKILSHFLLFHPPPPYSHTLTPPAHTHPLHHKTHPYPHSRLQTSSPYRPTPPHITPGSPRLTPARPGSPPPPPCAYTVQATPPRPRILSYANLPPAQPNYFNQTHPSTRLKSPKPGLKHPGPGRPGSARAGPGHLKNIPFHAPFSRYTELGHPAGTARTPWAGPILLCNRSGQRAGFAQKGGRVPGPAGPGQPGPARAGPVT